LNSGNLNIRSCCLEGCCLGEPDEKTKKPYCDGIKKDFLCEELDKCFETNKSTQPAGQKTNRRRFYIK
jgi:hypothetical protein